MAELKTKENDGDVTAFLNTVEKDQKREDSFALLALMEDVTGEPGKMWGETMVGIWQLPLQIRLRREADWMLVGFSPRKQNLTLYIMAGFDNYDELLGKLGKHKTGKSCLYINKLADVDQGVLRQLVKESVNHMITTNS